MTKKKQPNLIKWGLKYSLTAALAGILCCVAPAVLFMFGLMGGVYAISFADFFYKEDVIKYGNTKSCSDGRRRNR